MKKDQIALQETNNIKNYHEKRKRFLYACFIFFISRVKLLFHYTLKSEKT